MSRWFGNAMWTIFGAWFVVAFLIGAIAYGAKSRDCAMEAVAAGLTWPIAMIGYTNTYNSMIETGRVMCNEARQVARTVQRDYLIGSPR